MTPGPAPGQSGERFSAAALDHFTGLLGYSAVPERRPASGGWRRLYLKDGGEGMLAAVGGEGGRFVSLGVEIAVPKRVAKARLEDLLRALAPYEVAVDPDAGADAGGADAVVRVALRLFTEALTAQTVADAVANVSEAAREARRALQVQG